MIPASNTGGIHELIGMIQSVQETPETEAARAEAMARRQRGLTHADLTELSMQAYQFRQAREAQQAVQSQAAISSGTVEQFTAEVIAGGNAAATRRQRPGSSLGINT